MAERRMFTKKVTDDDNFMALSSSAQALYLHLSMSADDDGFCNQVSISMFKAHASVQDLQTLLEKRYVYQFESGVIVIKHWRMANALRKDRYTPTAFQNELSMLGLKDSGVYTWLPDGCQTVAACPPQDRIGKDRIGKDRLDEDIPRDSIDRTEKDVENHVENACNGQESSDLPLIEIQNLYHSICVSFPKIETIDEKTKNAISQTWQKYKNLDVFKTVFTIAEGTDFLKSKDARSWASFKWFMRLDNFDKVLAGNYKKFAKEQKSQEPQKNLPGFDLDEFFNAACSRDAASISEEK